MQTVIINVGVSGAGKSTWATNYIRQNSGIYRINRDAIRIQLVGTLDGYYQRRDLNFLEQQVTTIEHINFMHFLEEGCGIIIDNTNLKKSYIDSWVEFVSHYNASLKNPLKFVDVKFKLFTLDSPEMLKKRVNVRDAPLGWDKLDYIDKQLKNLPLAIKYVEDNFKDKII